MKLVLGISGASGAGLGIKFLAKILELKVFLNEKLKVFVVVSNGAKMVLNAEDGIDFQNLDFTQTLSQSCDLETMQSLESCSIKSIRTNFMPNNLNKNLRESINIILKYKDKITIFDDMALDAPIASGSFGVDAMIVAPCSSNTLAKINCGISDTLLTRSAFVCLKEQKKLILSPREMPLNSIMLENMLNLSKLGVIIAPPILGYYSKASNLEEMENFLFGKWLDLLNIKNSLYKRWK